MGRMDLKYVDNWKFVLGVNKVLTGFKDIDIDSLEEKVGILVNGLKNTSALLKSKSEK